jgi:hypothetical protein
MENKKKSQKKYYENNRDKLLGKKTCELCGRQFVDKNRHERTMTHRLKEYIKKDTNSASE